jgi:hypothetical protein
VRLIDGCNLPINYISKKEAVSKGQPLFNAIKLPKKTS